MPIYYLENIIQSYEWGSYTAIPKLLCSPPPYILPQAELWMGAHPKSSSKVISDFNKLLLSDLIKNNPSKLLGEETYSKFGPNLPYLFKILAVEKPLSIQVHPNKEQAKTGFNKENLECKPINSPERNYKDKNQKIECMCALTPLWGLIGLRRVEEIQSFIDKVCPNILTKSFHAFLKEPNYTGLEKFLRSLILLPNKDMKLAISETLTKAKLLKRESFVFDWVCRLSSVYPTEISMFAPLILNLVKLKPGQAVLILHGVPHTYMKGMGVEIMINSDNTLRAGLTHKHTDISEFLNITKFTYQPVSFVKTEIVRSCEMLYKTSTAEFELSKIKILNHMFYISSQNRNIEILFCVRGKGVIIDKSSNLVIKLNKGNSLLITPSVKQYEIHGKVTVFKASVPV